MRQAMFFPTDNEIGRIKSLGGRPPVTQEEITAVEVARRYGYTVTKATTHSCDLRDAKDICEHLSAIAAFKECDLRNFVRAIGGYSS